MTPRSRPSAHLPRPLTEQSRVPATPRPAGALAARGRTGAGGDGWKRP